MIISRLKNTISQANRFILAARGANQQFSISIWRAFLYLIAARVLYGHGPQSFSIYRLAGRPMKEWPHFLWEPDVLDKLARINPPPLKYLARNKWDFYQHCLRNGIPTVPILFRYNVNHDDPGNSSPSVKKADVPETARFLDALRNAGDKLFFKPISGAHGSGALWARKTNDGRWLYNGITGDTGALYQYCRHQHFKSVSWICQPMVEAHPQLKPLMATCALGTIRIITYLSAGSPILKFAVIRLPAGTNVTDNFSQGKGGNLVAPVDISTGEIGKAWHSTSQAWPEIEPIAHHPDTGAEIAGSKVPFWDDVCELVRQGQVATPQLRTIGWDVAVTNQGPLIIEANTEYSIDLIQIAHNRGLRHALAPITGLADLDTRKPNEITH